jgi:probable rRNA maturation factor
VERATALERSKSTMDADTPPADPEPGSCTSSRSPSSPISGESPSIDLADKTDSMSPRDIAWLASGFRRCAALARGPEGHPEDDIRVVIVNDDEMCSLHEQYKGASSPTDVLTFDLRESESEPLDVDLIVCLDEARRQSSGRPHEFIHELLLYALHGLLHCLGHDDLDASSSARMHLREDEILREARVGDVFGVAERSSGGES